MRFLSSCLAFLRKPFSLLHQGLSKTRNCENIPHPSETTDANNAHEHAKVDLGDLKSRVADIYAQTDGESHECVAGVDDGEGEDTYRHDKRYPIYLPKICQYIPVSKTKHIWGDITRDYINWHEDAGYLRFCKKRRQKGWYFRAAETQTGLFCKGLPADYVFHSQPTDDFYSNIPSVEDIFFFLRYRHSAHVVVGRASCTILKKTEATLPTIIALHDWEQKPKNRYQRVRLRKRHSPEPGRELENELKIEHRYITIALRHIGLKREETIGSERVPNWPTKLSARRQVWISAIEQLGITVSQIPRY